MKRADSWRRNSPELAIRTSAETLKKLPATSRVIMLGCDGSVTLVLLLETGEVGEVRAATELEERRRWNSTPRVSGRSLLRDTIFDS